MMCLVLTLAASGQMVSKDIEAVTPEGKIVVLKADGTWAYKPVVKGKILGVTKAAFATLAENMSYADAVSILGKEGEITDETVTFGGSRTVSYEWKPASGTLTLIFQNDKLFSKIQYGLK